MAQKRSQKQAELAGLKLPAVPEELQAARRPKQNGKQTYSRQETRIQLQAMERLAMRPFVTRADITRIMKAEYGVGPTRVDVLYRRVRQGWAEEDEARRESNKAAQIRRLTRCLEQAYGEPLIDRQTGRHTGWLVPPDHKAIIAYERLLADLQGTREPVRVDVDVRVSQAVSHVIMGLTPGQVQSCLQEYREMKQAAESYRLLQQANTTNGTGPKDPIQ